MANGNTKEKAKSGCKSSLVKEQNKSLFIMSTVLIIVIAIVGFATAISGGHNTEQTDKTSSSLDGVINDLEYFKGK